MYECFHCLRRTVSWDADFDPSDFGMEEEGVVHMLHCNNCGAQIQYFSPIRKEDTNGNTE